LRHAFALDEEAFAPDAEEQVVLERLAQEIVRRRLTTPALLLLEVGRPLNFVSAQALHFLQPLLACIADARSLEVFARLVERRGAVDALIARIEASEPS
jgi:hypothetical protein